jgi:ABC-type lipoprotein release transport system permease subunit
LLQLHLPFRPVVVLAAVTAAVCGLATVVPARRVTRLEPAVALRYE